MVAEWKNRPEGFEWEAAEPARSSELEIRPRRDALRGPGMCREQAVRAA